MSYKCLHFRNKIQSKISEISSFYGHKILNAFDKGAKVKWRLHFIANVKGLHRLDIFILPRFYQIDSYNLRQLFFGHNSSLINAQRFVLFLTFIYFKNNYLQKVKSAHSLTLWFVCWHLIAYSNQINVGFLIANQFYSIDKYILNGSALLTSINTLNCDLCYMFILIQRFFTTNI